MNEYDTLLKPLSESGSMGNSNMTFFINFLNKLEGYKTRLKNLHWAAPAMNIHVKLDEMLDIVSDYQDEIAEEAMGIYNQMAPNVLNAIPCECTDPVVLLETLRKETTSFYMSLGSYVGLKSETETFIHNINKYIFLFRLCKG